MIDWAIAYSTFSSRFNRNRENRSASAEDILNFEETLNIRLPEDFKLFISTYGNLWTPDILDIVVDNDMNIPDIQQFWELDEIIDDKKIGYTSQIDEDMIAFASDCMGNIFSFLVSNLKQPKSKTPVYYFDLDLNQKRLVANSFIELVEEFNTLPYS